MNRLKGKRAFLTAAGAGIGRATAIAFAAEGAHVIATDLKLDLIDRPERAGASPRSMRSMCAIPRPCNALADKVGPVDVLFNCAGFVHHGTVLTTSDERVGLLLRHQRQVDAPDDQRVPARHAGEGRRLDHQHRVRRIVGPRHPEPLRLRRLEGGGHRPNQVGRGRLHPPGHPLQRHRPGTIQSPSLDAAHRRAGKGAGQADPK